MDADRLQSAVEFEDGRIDGYYADRKVLTLQGPNLIYFGSDGIRTQTLVGSVDRSASELAQKLQQLAQAVNTHSDVPLLLPQLWKNVEFITKLKRIREFVWPLYDQKAVVETETGWKVSCLDGSASVELQRDLFTVKVVYLQDVNQREIQENEHVEYSSKFLLQKYQLPYHQYTGDGLKSSVVYRYLRTIKLFNVYAVPLRWKYPCGLLWRYIQESSLIQEQPLFVPEILLTPVPTSMPQPRNLSEQSAQPKFTNSTIPIFRYPNHSSRCRWVTMDVEALKGVIWFKEGGPLGFDGKAFWEQVGDTFHLKFFNTIESEKVYHMKGVPQVVRCGNYSNSAQEFLNVIASYNKHYHQQHTRPAEVAKGGFEEVHSLTNEYAKMSAFGNRFVKARFHNGVILTYDLNKSTAKVINRYGQQFVLPLSDAEYREYLEVVLRYAEEIFEPQDKHWRETMSEELSHCIQANLSSMSVLEGRPVMQHIRNISTSIVSDPRTFSVEEALARNNKLLAELKQLS